jgi:dihydroorotase
MPTTSCLLIRGARVLLPNGEFLVGDVEIRESKILRVAPSIAAVGDREIMAKGLTLLPGVIAPGTLPGTGFRTQGRLVYR